MPRLDEYRQRFANDLHAMGPTPTGGIATGGTTGSAGAPGTLVQANWPVLSFAGKDDAWQGAFLFRPQATHVGDKVRMLDDQSQTYEPGSGTFVTDGIYTTAPASGFSSEEPYELHLHGWDPYNEIPELVNQALKEIMIPVQVPIIPTVVTAGPYLQNLTRGDGSGDPHSRIAALLHDSWAYRLDLLPSGASPVQEVVFGLNPLAGTSEIGFQGYTAETINWDDDAAAIQVVARQLAGLEEVVVSGTLGSALDFDMIGAPLDATFLITFPNFALTGIAMVPVPIVSSGFTRSIGQTLPLSARLYQRGPEVMAEFDRRFVSGDRIYVTTLIRAYDWCRSALLTSFGSQTGLALESDEATPVVEWVSAQMQVQAWLRNPRRMQENLEKRRCLALQDAQDLATAYQEAYLQGVTVSDLLTFDVQGAPFKRPLPSLLSLHSTGGAA